MKFATCRAFPDTVTNMLALCRPLLIISLLVVPLVKCVQARLIKPSKIFPKNPAQHAADLKMLTTIPELQQAVQNHLTGLPKSVACIRVDAAGDERPGH